MINIDVEKRILTVEKNGVATAHELGSREAFEILSAVWLRAGWEVKYSYTFTWFGRPVLQLPEDLVRLQEVITRLRPDVIVETGIAHGGSLIFCASLFEAMHHGRVIGIDVEIRPHNRKAIEAHELFHRITLVEADSAAGATGDHVRSLIAPNETVMVILDSNHTKDHVLRELELYGSLVTVDSYVVATDGLMKDLVGAPRAKPDWETNNPYAAANDFLSRHPEFRYEQPPWLFNESDGLAENITQWPGAWLRRIR